MASLIKINFYDSISNPYDGQIKTVTKFIWFPRILPAPRLSSQRQLRWLGFEKIQYEYKNNLWDEFDPKWVAVSWYW